MDLQLFKTKCGKLAVTAEHCAVWGAQKTVSIATWSVPYYSRLGLYPQALFVVAALVWFEYRPTWAIQGPGVAMGFLAVAAMWVAVRGSDTTRIEGAVWVAVAFFLFAGEMHFVAVERTEHDVDQAELRSKEEDTRREQTESFTRLIREGERLFRALNEEKILTAKNLEHITGGNGYCWVVPLSPLPIGLSGVPAPQGDNWWQLGLRNSGNVVLPTCDLRFMPFPTQEEFKSGVVPSPPFLSYHFEKVAVLGRRYAQTTPYFIKGDRMYSGVIQTPTRSFVEVIKFEPDPNSPTRYIPKCTVAELPEKVLENDCNPQ